MKRSLFRVGAALATLALAGTLAACSNNSSSSSSEKPAGPASASASADSGAAAPGEDAGFEEQPLGDDVHVGPLVVGGVYFQPVDMEPEVGTPAAESSMHIEADISAAADNKLGFGAGDFIPGLTVDYTIKDMALMVAFTVGTPVWNSPAISPAVIQTSLPVTLTILSSMMMIPRVMASLFR